MSENRTDVVEGLDRSEMSRPDAADIPHIGFVFLEKPAKEHTSELPKEQHSNEPGHVDLRREGYTPHQLARLLSTSLDAVMHAIWRGELKAERRGRHTVYLARRDILDWLSRWSSSE